MTQRDPADNKEKKENEKKGWKTRKSGRLVAYVGGGIAGILLVLFSIEPAASMADPAPPGKLVDVGGFEMHLYCTGEGSPTVILDGGLGQGTVYWSEVQESVSQHTRVCSYDRAGLGWSEPGPKPRTYMKATDELHTLLNAAGEKGPYVLVGHSSGAHTVRFFVNEYPDDVAGIVLEDAAYEKILTQEALAPGVKAMRDSSSAARLGYYRLNEGELLRFAGINLDGQQVPADMKQYLHVIFNSKTFATSADELEVMHETAAALESTKHEGAWRDIPAIVLSADNEMGKMMGLHEHHRQLASLSTQGEQVMVSSSHNIHIEHPEVVIDAILKVADMAS